MKRYLMLLILLLAFGCNSSKISKGNKNYKTETLVIEKISDHVYQHTSFLETKSFGKVACNGMIVLSKNEAIIFDTPTDNKTSLELIDWVEKKANCKIKAIVPTHFHSDCLGGLDEFHRINVPSYANNLTINLAASQKSILPKNGFNELLELKVGDTKVIAHFIGEGHTKDNIIGYFPDEKIMFGGCLIKEIGAGKGYLSDANTNEWPLTVAKLKETYSSTNIVIPGHGKPGGLELLDYTIKLFE